MPGSTVSEPVRSPAGGACGHPTEFGRYNFGRPVFRGPKYAEARSQAEPLRILARLSPLIFENDIGEGDTANRPEPTHRVADRQQSVGVDAGRQTECSLRFLFE